MGNHSAEHRSGRRPSREKSVASAGRRRASKPARGPLFRGSLLRRLPTMPLVGLAALAVAGAGAISVDSAAIAPDPLQLAAQSPSLTGTDAVGFVGEPVDPRERAISRDSERQALQDTADAKLQAAAEQNAAERNAELKSLGKAAEARAGEIAKNTWVLPTSGYRLTARFGNSGGMWSSNHTGLDMAAPSGTPIVAIANGLITETGSAGAYGNRTVMTLEDGTEIWFCHQTEIGVRTGQKVSGGQQIGTVGSTGNSTGPHLHLEVRPGGGDPVDPERALAFHGLKP